MVQVAIEYSRNLGPEADIELLIRKLAHRLCDAKGPFTPAAVQVTGHCLTEYAVGEGPGERAFVNLTVRLDGAQANNLPQDYLESLFSLVKDHLADLYQRRRMAIAMRVEEHHGVAAFWHSNLDAPSLPG